MAVRFVGFVSLLLFLVLLLPCSIHTMQVDYCGEVSFRKMDDKKRPHEFVPEADLQGIRPLPSDFDKWKRYKVEDDRRGYSSKRGRLSAGMV